MWFSACVGRYGIAQQERSDFACLLPLSPWERASQPALEDGSRGSARPCEGLNTCSHTRLGLCLEPFTSREFRVHFLLPFRIKSVDLFSFTYQPVWSSKSQIYEVQACLLSAVLWCKPLTRGALWYFLFRKHKRGKKWSKIFESNSSFFSAIVFIPYSFYTRPHFN